MGKTRTLTIDMYGSGTSGQAPYLVKGYRTDGGTPRTHPAESDQAVLAWVKGQLKRFAMEQK